MGHSNAREAASNVPVRLGWLHVSNVCSISSIRSSTHHEPYPRRANAAACIMMRTNTMVKYPLNSTANNVTTSCIMI